MQKFLQNQNIGKSEKKEFHKSQDRSDLGYKRYLKIDEKQRQTTTKIIKKIDEDQSFLRKISKHR